MGEKKADLLGSSLSGHTKRSFHGKDEFMSVTVRKDDPNEKVGILLETDPKGRIRVVNIATNGLFADSEVAIGDIVLSVNGKRLAKGEGPEVLVEVIAKASSKVTVVVKKADIAPRVPEKPDKDPSVVKDNNVARVDSYYAGQSKHNEDGSMAFYTKEEVERNKSKKEQIIACTITANKDDTKGDLLDDTAGLMFVVQNKLLFVAAIDETSCFRKTDLEVGDRVLSINDCNFRSYADAALASNHVGKAPNAVTVLVEKGVKGFTRVSRVEIETFRRNVQLRAKNSSSSQNPLSQRSSLSTSARRSVKDDPKPNKLKSRISVSNPKHDPVDTFLSVDIDDVDDEDSFGGDDVDEEPPSSRKSRKEVVIVAPKKFSAQEVGVLFKTIDNRFIVVKEIQGNSIFANTSLEVGDIVLEINGTDYRRNPDHIDAWKTCRTTKESVTMLVRKEEINVKQQEFNLDASSTSLKWQ